MFAGCRSTRAKTVNIDGRHERELCDEHASGLHEIWMNRRHAYRITWGLWTHEKIERDQARINQLLALHGEPSDGWWSQAVYSYEEEDDEDGAVGMDYSTGQQQAWDEIGYLRERVSYLADEGERPPVVQVEPRR